MKADPSNAEEIPPETLTDVAVVGAGPIGLELAVALKRRGVDYVQVDAKQIGHTISWFPPQTRFFSSNDRIAIAGVPLQTPDQNKSTREQYLAYLRCVVQQFDLQVRTFEPVIGIERGERPGGRGGFRILTRPAAGERVIRCRRLVLATGGTATPRRLGIRGEDLPHVSHHYADAHEYFRRRLLVVGGKNSAIESMLRCHHAGASVALSYRRASLEPQSVKYWLLPEAGSLLKSGQIEAHFQTVPVEITPTHVLLRRSAGGDGGVTPYAVRADAVLLMIGYEADMSLCRMAGVELAGECQRPAYDPRTMETNVPGVYLAGTVTGGTQDKYTVFIENGHAHTDRIVAALAGETPPDGEDAAAVREMPES